MSTAHTLKLNIFHKIVAKRYAIIQVITLEKEFNSLDFEMSTKITNLMILLSF